MTKTKDKKEEKFMPKYVKNINDYSQVSILLDEIIDPKTNNSLLDIIAYGENPYNDLLKDVKKKSKKEQDKIFEEFGIKTAGICLKVLEKNLVMTVSIAKNYTTEDLEENPGKAVSIVLEMINEFSILKKKYNS